MRAHSQIAKKTPCARNCECAGCRQSSHSRAHGRPLPRAASHWLSQVGGPEAVRHSTEGDRFEVKANRIADAVVRSPMVSASSNVRSTRPNGIEPSGGPLLASAPAAVPQVGAVDRTNTNVGGGAALPSSVRSEMEPRFGYDFANVRIHTDAASSRVADALGARAFTIGNNVVFGRSSFAPDTRAGRWLIAHELTHVLQQTATTGVPREGAMPVQQHTGAPALHGAWHLDSDTHEIHRELATTSGNASQMLIPTHTGVVAIANAHQEWGWVRAEEGGRAHVAGRVTRRLVFRNDGASDDFLSLTIGGNVTGNAKAEDMSHARASGVIVGSIIERTAANPTPPAETLLGPIADGGVSTASMGTLGNIDASIPVGEGGTVRVQFPITRVNQGQQASFSESEDRPRSVSNSVDEVDVFLTAHVDADSDIESSFFGLNPLISPDRNTAMASAIFHVGHQSRPAPGRSRLGSRTGTGDTETAPGPSDSGPRVGLSSAAFRMRSQVQQDHHHWGSATVNAADDSRGVTATEFEGAQARAKDEAIANGLPGTNVHGVNRAKAEQSRRIRQEIVPNGVTQIGDINQLRICFDPDTNNLVTCRRGQGQIRLDVENLAGHNLRYAR